MKKIFLILAVIIFGVQIFSCKKDESLKERKAISTDGLNNSQGKPNALFETGVTSYYKTFPIDFKNKTSSPTDDVTFSWCNVSNNVFTEFADTKEISALMYPDTGMVTIGLIATNKFGVDTFIKEMEIRDVPKSAQITAVVLDSVNYINPITSAAWNASGGPNVYFEFHDILNQRIDSLPKSANNNQFGWATALAGTQIAAMTLNNVSSTPIAWPYPSGTKYLLFAKMLDAHSLKVFNKNPSGVNELIGEMNFKFIDYFRNAAFSASATNPDISKVSLRSADGKTVIIITIKYLT